MKYVWMVALPVLMVVTPYYNYIQMSQESPNKWFSVLLTVAFITAGYGFVITMRDSTWLMKITFFLTGILIGGIFLFTIIMGEAVQSWDYLWLMLIAGVFIVPFSGLTYIMPWPIVDRIFIWIVIGVNLSWAALSWYFLWKGKQHEGNNRAVILNPDEKSVE